MLLEAQELRDENEAILDELSVVLEGVIDEGVEAKKAYCAMPEPKPAKSYLPHILVTAAVCCACQIAFCLRFH